MDGALVLSCLLLGLGGAPHCAAMCGATSAALTCAGTTLRVPPAAWAFHLARVAGYAAVGALASAGVGAADLARAASPALRPFWVLLHAAALGLGLWLAVMGRQPRWLVGGGWGRHGALAMPGGWQPLVFHRGAWRAAIAGASWVAWPCGLLQSALVVAALCRSPGWAGLAMGSFALASAPGLLLMPWVVGRLGRAGTGGAGLPEAWVRLAIRSSGAALAAGALYALNRDAWHRFATYCTT